MNFIKFNVYFEKDNEICKKICNQYNGHHSISCIQKEKVSVRLVAIPFENQMDIKNQTIDENVNLISGAIFTRFRGLWSLNSSHQDFCLNNEDCRRKILCAFLTRISDALNASTLDVLDIDLEKIGICINTPEVEFGAIFAILQSEDVIDIFKHVERCITDTDFVINLSKRTAFPCVENGFQEQKIDFDINPMHKLVYACYENEETINSIDYIKELSLEFENNQIEKKTKL